MSLEVIHFHSPQCDSTQTQILEYLRANSTTKPLLFSSSFQTLGRGRQGNTWQSASNSLALSFTVKPNEVLTLTSLELGVLICDFLSLYKLQLKWPNDILTHDLFKCGGILCQTYSEKIVAGLGLNLGQSEKIEKCEEFKFGRSSITNKSLSNEEIKNISLELYEYILSNRISSIEVIKKWNDKCAHMNKNVLIKDDTFHLEGVFKGIGSSGEALIEDKGLIQKAYSGSIYLI
ncbi:biotin--[acetyl-CoA-carboxylase] ligase [Halobacteriovorax sp. HLS]|uniref:biotin--[acetyl-CoA-carboxylase] ligase n=1 Tax=Halobacteriovorax sp. HLS TaxID=2234000 RepID=UPI000FDAB440|nr:biotin--[acetyl-CoA-carboxylase] ligase [Halobacteriovorax sp. HLS]